MFQRIIVVPAVVATALLVSASALAQKDATGGLRVFSETGADVNANKIHVMITIFRAGKAVAQDEIDADYNTNFDLPEGTYRVRWEGPGLKTVEKNGVLVRSDRDREVRARMEKGSGTSLHVYSTGIVPTGLTQKEVQKRIEQLRQEIDYLENK